MIAAIDARSVCRDFRIAGTAWWSLAAVLALAAVLGAWWLRSEAPPGPVASPPLERLLVLPMHHDGDPGLAPQVAAMGDHLRDAFVMVPGFAVVDAERTRLALQQLDPAGASQPNIAGLYAVASAKRILQPELVSREGGWLVHARLHSPGAPVQRLDGPVAADPAAAVRAWSEQPASLRRLGLGTGELVPVVPAATDALTAFGAARLARQRGRLEEALQHLLTASKLVPGYTAAWIEQAEVAMAIGELDVATDAIDRALQLTADAPQRQRSRVAAERALLDGDAPAAIAAWQSVLAATPDDTYAELQLARAHGSAGDFPKAVESLQALTQRDPNDPRAWFELGKFVLLSGDAQRAVDDYLVRALVLYKRSRDVFGEAETVNALGIGYGRLGQTTDAAEQYRKAVELRRALGNRRGVATSLRNLANVLALTGEFDEAAAYLEQARDLQSELGDREGLAATDNEMGLLAEERGNYPDALAAFRRALQGSRQAGNAHGSAEALNNIGFAHFQLGAYDDAQVYWQQAAEAYAKLGSRTGEIRTGQNLGLLAIARGQWGEARRRLEASLASAQQQQMPEEAAVSHRNLAEMELLQGRLEAAMQHLDHAEPLFRQRQDQRGILDVGLLRAQAWMLANADRQALGFLDDVQPSLTTAATEQRAIAQLLRAEIASRSGDERAASEALRQAREFAARSGVRVLQLQIALRDARAGTIAPGLDASIT
ncbi:MAG: tetratricopeptide repeat protein, partial [Lysobacter sp.]|nr:tetratricopeptide repeat protein [Lysobacter sp.]